MKKFGYTIAETLITLAIIGVVGAITLPTFISNHRNQTNAAALSVAISNLENGLTAYIMKEGATSFDKTRAWEELYSTGGKTSNTRDDESLRRFVNALDGTLSLSYVNGTDKNFKGYYSNLELKDVTGQEVADYRITMGSPRTPEYYWTLKAKNGVVYFIYFTNIRAVGDYRIDDSTAITEAQAMAAGGVLTTTLAEVIIDVNGTKLPNTVGRDIFKFNLGTDGILYPCGSIDYSIKNQDLTPVSWKDSDCEWTCNDGEIDGVGLGCTARLIDENFKPTY